MRVAYTGAAERDFVEIGARIARDHAATALRFQTDLETFIARIAENPKLYRVREEWGGVRAARLKGYLVIFDVEEDELLVLRIASGRRNIASMLRETAR